MKKKKIAGSAMFILLIGLILIENVFAMGITPGRTIVDYDKTTSLIKTIPFTLMNNEDKLMNVEFEVQGDQETTGYVSLKDQLLSFSGTDKSKDSEYYVNIPSGIELSAGTHKVDIIAKEYINPKEDENRTGASATVAVITQLHIQVPYPEEYADAKLTIVGGEGNDAVNFYIEIINLGEKDIENANAEVRITGPEGFKEVKIETNEKNVRQKTKEEISATWIPNGDDPSGIYHAEVSLKNKDKDLKINGKSNKILKDFKVRDLMMDILNISAIGKFSLDKPAQFGIWVKSNWSEEMMGAYIQTLIDEKGNSESAIANFDSAPFSVKPYDYNDTTAWWDTASTREKIREGFDNGLYVTTGRMILHYNGRTSQKMMKSVNVGEDIFTASLTGAVVGGGKGGSFKLSNFLIFLLVVLVILNIAWFVYFNKKIKKK